MMPSNGSVSPNTKSRSSRPAPGMRSRPMPKPAIVEMTSETGTTATTMNRLEASRAVMFATRNASKKLPHCGSDGQDSPTGALPDGCNAVVKMLMNGSRMIATRASSHTRPAYSSRRSTLIAPPRGSAAGSGG